MDSETQETDEEVDEPGGSSIRDSEARAAEASIGDAATSRDELGFAPYVAAVARFLTSPATQPPLTFSVEGEWGSGKSSFMLQLKGEIKRADPDRFFCVDFNAWRHQNDEALWAAFALNFVRAMRVQVRPWSRRFVANLRATLKRVDTENGRWRLLRAVAGLIAIIVLGFAGIFGYFVKGTSLAPSPAWLASAIAFLFVAVTSLAAAWKRIGSPFEADLQKYFDVPDYRGKRSFVESFQADFEKLVTSYVRADQGERVYVFIDDLDRCDIAQSAQLLQAVNLLMSGENLPIIYVFGIDRAVVAASVAATLEKQIPYLSPGAKETERDSAGIDLAVKYIEKFINVPFRVPTPNAYDLKKYLISLAPVRPSDPKTRKRAAKMARILHSPVAASTRPPAVDVDDSPDSPIIVELTLLVAKLFDYNPRRIKTFLNVYRLQVMLANRLDLFEEKASRSATLTIQKLAKITALTLKYPSLASKMLEKPWLLKALQMRADGVPFPQGISMGEKRDDRFNDIPLEDADLAFYGRQKPLQDLLVAHSVDDNYHLEALDVRPLLMTVPARDGRLKRFSSAETEVR